MRRKPREESTIEEFALSGVREHSKYNTKGIKHGIRILVRKYLVTLT